MQSGVFIVAHFIGPKEKYWGRLISLGPAGITLRGIDVDLFDDWARQMRNPQDAELGLATLFVPIHRVEKIFEDSRIGTVASYQERFFQIAGQKVLEFLTKEALEQHDPSFSTN